MKKEKYLIHCPKCKSTFDVSPQMEIWKRELFEKIEKIVIELKGGKNKWKQKADMKKRRGLYSQ